MLWWALVSTEAGLYSTWGAGCMAQVQSLLHSRVGGFRKQPLLLLLNLRQMSGNHRVLSLASRVCSVFFGEPRGRVDGEELKSN